jgi:hypothetical protein
MNKSNNDCGIYGMMDSIEPATANWEGGIISLSIVITSGNRLRDVSKITEIHILVFVVYIHTVG